MQILGFEFMLCTYTALKTPFLIDLSGSTENRIPKYYTTVHIEVEGGEGDGDHCSVKDALRNLKWNGKC